MTALIIAFANQKGGVTKTTGAVATWAALNAQGVRCLLVDADAQASATAATGHDFSQEGEQYANLHTLMARRINGVRAVLPHTAIYTTAWGELLPSHIDLAAMELDLIRAVRREYIIRDVLAELRADFHVILVDCPPSLSLITLNALTAADRVIIPTVPDFLSAQGLGRLYSTIDLVSAQLNPDLRVFGVLFTRVKPTREHTARQADIRAFCGAVDWPVLPLEVKDSIRAAEAASQGIPLTANPTGNGLAEPYHQLATLIAQGAHHATSA
jgi:chromosome partitioning protein